MLLITAPGQQFGTLIRSNLERRATPHAVTTTGAHAALAIRVNAGVQDQVPGADVVMRESSGAELVLCRTRVT